MNQTYGRVVSKLFADHSEHFEVCEANLICTEITDLTSSRARTMRTIIKEGDGEKAGLINRPLNIMPDGQQRKHTIINYF